MRVLAFVLSLVVSLNLVANTPESIELQSGAVVRANHGVVTSRSALASQVGAEIMAAGGNAIDAAVATGFALAVTYPSAGNVGGGGFAVVRLADGRTVTLDSRERAPGKADRDMYLDQDGNVVPGLSTRTHKASGVPGSVDGLLILLETHGSMDRHRVLAPAIRLAEQGFPLDEDLAEQFARVSGSMQSYPASLAKFTNGGKAYKAGDIWVQKDLAHTLKLIDQHGRAGFYQGEIAEKIVAEMQRGGGVIELQDLKDYQSVWRDPIQGSYRGYQIWTMAPPSSGALVVQLLNFLEPYKVGAMGWGSPEVAHLMIEAERRAYADRALHMGDPDFYPVPVAKLIAKDYAKQRFADFDPKKASRSDDIGAGQFPEESPQTTHFSVMDKAGNAVAITTTLNSSFGSKIVVPGTGILLNNEMDDFSAKEDVANQFGLVGRSANAIEPGKRMLSSMSPTIVTKDGKTVLITGSPGGSTIITTVFQVIVNVIDHQMTPEQAVAAPRFHHQWRPESIMTGPNAFSAETLKTLNGMGHDQISDRFRGGIGDANTIVVEHGVMVGVKDPRNEGAAVGW